MEKLINHVMEFVIKLSEIDTTTKNLNLKKYRHIDVELTTEDNIQWIQITHCSLYSCCPNWKNILKNYACERTIDNRTILVIFKPCDSNYELIYDFNEFNPISRVSSITHNHFKQYLIIKIMHQLTKEELKLLKLCLQQKLINLNEIYKNSKYTFRCGAEMLCNTLVPFDKIYNNCHLLSSAIEKIITSSTNDEFRQQCSQLLNTTQSGVLRNTIFIKLLGIFHNNYEFENK